MTSLTLILLEFLLFSPLASSVKVVSGKAARNMLLQFHAEYTSITDELESVCHMMVSPTSTVSMDKPRSQELTKHQFAAMIEKQHLKECEDNDYEIMKNLIVARESLDEADDMLTMDVAVRKVLKRDSAFEIPVTPSKSLGGGFVEESEVPASSRFNRNLSADRAYSRQNSPSNLLLNPTQSMDQKLLRKSMDSLAKNSSSETEYSLQPYKVIKQSSNETNTSMTGSSFNVDNASLSLANDSSLDQTAGDTSLNQTVIENPLQAGSSAARHPLKMGAAFLRKQFSTEKSVRIDPESSLPFAPKNIQTVITEDEVVGMVFQSEGGSASRLPSHVVVMQAKKHQQLATDSSSSTEDGRMLGVSEPRSIPAINSETIQDEIAKLSSNIKGSNGEEDEEGEKEKAPINETMC